MIEKSTIEKILRLNGLGPDAPDEEIKSILFSAKWHERDVETALIVLREDGQQNQSVQVQAVHQVLNTDQKIDPTDLQSILGIDIDVSSLPSEVMKDQGYAIKAQIFSIILVSLAFAAASLVGLMWFFGIGIFYTST